MYPNARGGGIPLTRRVHHSECTTAHGVRAPFARGCATFHAGPGEFSAFLKACRRIGLRCASVVASREIRRAALSVAEAEALAVFQDLPPGSAPIAPLLREFVYPAWLRSMPVCFFSLPGEDEYGGRKSLSSLLHSDAGAIERALAEEQLLRLIDPESRAGSSAESPPTGSSSPSDEVLDASQAAAAAHGKGPMRVLAPAGSGKTRTIVHRIERLVADGASPGGILPVAFNRKAAAEMNTRLAAMGLGDVRARTFHSLGYEIVRCGSSYTFDAENESAVTSEIVLQALKTMHPGCSLEEGSGAGTAARQVSDVKMNLLDPDRLVLKIGGDSFPFGPVFRKCLEIQESRRFMNYDDMIYFALRILLDDPAARRTWQEKWTYVLVDEFQDLNPSQLLMLRILAHPHDNLFIVGDDDQAIYGWRGGSVRGLLNFPTAYPSSAGCLLSTNYRSARRIIAHAGWLIAHNKDRAPKRVTVRSGAPQGEFCVRLTLGLREQAREAALWIAQERSGSSLLWSDIAVLYRYNMLAFIVSLALDEQGIPHDCDIARPLFSSRVGQDVLAWLRYLLGKPGVDDLPRALSRPRRVLPYAIATGIRREVDLEHLMATCATDDPHAVALREFTECSESLRSLSGTLNAERFLEALDRAAGFRSPSRRRAGKWCDPDEADDATCFDVIQSLAAWSPSAADFLASAEEILRTPPAPRAEPATRDAVVLSTIHRAKGNEYSRVVMFDLSRRRRPVPAEVEEERRVAYVGLTRARDALLVTAEARRQSPFLREAALNPVFASSMRADLESELRALRRRFTRLRARARSIPGPGEGGELRSRIDDLEDELLCRAMLGLLPP